MSDLVDVRVEDLWKEFRVGTKRRAPRFAALKGLNFEVRRGEAFGIIGRNGAGKSTLLKVLAGITAPSRGRVTISGHLSALIEIGSGFHPELTGRENVFLAGAILGMKRRDIAEKLPSIFEFAGVERFIDTPVKWYSSGMYVRLGFSVAAHLDPEVLLIDEVLAVGDAEFQTKCLRRVHELKARGVTILLISHDLSAVEQLCDRAVLLEKGEVAATGPAADVIAYYHRSITAAAVQEPSFHPLAREGVLAITSLMASGPAASGHATSGEPLVSVVRYDATRALPVCFELSYYSSDGKTLIATTSTGAGSDAMTADAPGGEVEFLCPALPLGPGTYYMRVVAREADSGHVVDWWDGGTMLHVGAGRDLRGGQLLIAHEWRARVRHGAARVGERDERAQQLGDSPMSGQRTEVASPELPRQ
jgi:ABC-type polysaccharide/polyol phosphate transport system ATPase subunit